MPFPLEDAYSLSYLQCWNHTIQGTIIFNLNSWDSPVMAIWLSFYSICHLRVATFASVLWWLQRYETSRQPRFDAWYWMLGAGALGRPRGMVRGGRREEGSGWGTRVYLWQIHVDVWQNQYNIVNLKNKIKLKKEKYIYIKKRQNGCVRRPYK